MTCVRVVDHYLWICEYYVTILECSDTARISVNFEEENTIEVTANDVICRWMVVGSFGCTVFAIVPLVQQYESFYKSHDDLLPAVDFKITWSLLIFSGFFFTLGSFAFVRCVLYLY